MAELRPELPPCGSDPRLDATLDATLDAALALAGERPWGRLSLQEIAARAGLAVGDLYALSPGRDAVAEALSRRFDLAAFAPEPLAGPLSDRLFDSVMRRLEAMQAHRAAVLSILSEEAGIVLTARAPRTARALLEAAGLDSSGAKGAARVAAMAVVWTRVLAVWRADDGALNRTMAEIDRRLNQMLKALNRLGAGESSPT